MSAFLGPIHTWLYNKIKFQDELTKSIIDFVLQKEHNTELIQQMDLIYGVLEEGALEDIVDETNIHGWLQEKVNVVESRLAFLVTTVTDEQSERMMDINDVVYEFGKAHAIENGISVKEAYNHLDNLLLNGMPCDRVNEIINENEHRITWKQTVDIHEHYWNMVHGNVDYYYAIRENLISGMLEDSGIIYTQISEQTFELRKEV